MINPSQLKKIKIEVYSKYKAGKNLPYHNYAHTEMVVDSITRIHKCELYEHNPIGPLYLIVAAGYFHDVGNLIRRKDHEELSANMATDFLNKIDVPKSDQDVVANLILATKLGYTPKTISEQVIQDADMSSCGQENYIEISKKMREEFEISEPEWLKKQVEFLNTHTWKRKTSEFLFDEKKQEHLQTYIKLYDDYKLSLKKTA